MPLSPALPDASRKAEGVPWCCLCTARTLCTVLQAACVLTLRTGRVSVDKMLGADHYICSININLESSLQNSPFCLVCLNMKSVSEIQEIIDYAP